MLETDTHCRRVHRKTERKDFFTRILENRTPGAFSDIQLAAHASDMVLAGSETSSTCLSTITYHLFKCPSVLQELRNEIRGTFQSYGDITAASTEPLKYMRAVILEGLRIYPPLPFALPRLVPEGGDTVDSHFLPAGVRQPCSLDRVLSILAYKPLQTIVSTNPVAASLDPANFRDPHVFRPERWLGKNESDTLDASQPFSLGPRGCIGRRYVDGNPFSIPPIRDEAANRENVVLAGWRCGRPWRSYISSMIWS